MDSTHRHTHTHTIHTHTHRKYCVTPGCRYFTGLIMMPLGCFTSFLLAPVWHNRIIINGSSRTLLDLYTLLSLFQLFFLLYGKSLYNHRRPRNGANVALAHLHLFPFITDGTNIQFCIWIKKKIKANNCIHTILSNFHAIFSTGPKTKHQLKARRPFDLYLFL